MAVVPSRYVSGVGFGVQVAVDLFRHSEIEGVEDVYAEKEVGTEDLLLRP